MNDRSEARRNPVIGDFSPHVRDLLYLDATAHHHGRNVPRDFHAYEAATGHRPRHYGEYTQTAEGAYYEVSRQVHIALCKRLEEPEFFSEAHALIQWWSSRERRQAKRGQRLPLPPTQGVAFAYFLEQHRDQHDLAPCYPWWMGFFARQPEDSPPNLQPYTAPPDQ